MFLKFSQDLQENTCARISFLIKLQALACNVIKKETLALLSSCEFREIFKNTFFYRTPPVAAFVYKKFEEYRSKYRGPSTILTNLWSLKWLLFFANDYLSNILLILLIWKPIGMQFDNYRTPIALWIYYNFPFLNYK